MRLRPIKPVPPVTKAVFFCMSCTPCFGTVIGEASKLRIAEGGLGIGSQRRFVFPYDQRACHGTVRSRDHGFFFRPVTMKPLGDGGPARTFISTPSRERRGKSGVSFVWTNL